MRIRIFINFLEKPQVNISEAQNLDKDRLIFQVQIGKAEIVKEALFY